MPLSGTNLRRERRFRANEDVDVAFRFHRNWCASGCIVGITMA
jgi:hypothetical protein